MKKTIKGISTVRVIMEVMKRLPKQEQEEAKYMLMQWISEGQGWA